MKSNLKLVVKMVIAFFLWAVLINLMACGIQQQIREDPVKGSYYVALASFNDAVEAYLAQKATISEDLQNDIEALIFEADNALEIWGVAAKLGNADAYEKELAYKQIKTELFRLLFKYKFLELRE